MNMPATQSELAALVVNRTRKIEVMRDDLEWMRNQQSDPQCDRYYANALQSLSLLEAKTRAHAMVLLRQASLQPPLF